MAFTLRFSGAARNHLKAMRKRDQQIIWNAITEQLTHEPDQATRNRKLLEENPLAPWELRVRDFRVFYDVDRDTMEVVIVAVGEKSHNILRIGGKEIHL